jgi:hypothetical protein
MRRILCFLFLAIIVSGCSDFKKGMSEGRIKANEGLTQVICKTYAEKLNLYREHNKRFPYSFKELDDKGYFSPSDPAKRLILQSMPAQGYYFGYFYIDDNHFTLKAIPADKGVTGNNTFIIDETGELKIIY